MYLETAEYDKCIADCDSAVEKGRELRADYKVIARALTRKANALAKQERYEEAVQTYHKSLTEHRQGLALPQAFLKLSVWCRRLSRTWAKAYITQKSGSCVPCASCGWSRMHEKRAGAICVPRGETHAGCECMHCAVVDTP